VDEDLLSAAGEDVRVDSLLGLEDRPEGRAMGGTEL